jgi:hypothetical protein
MLLVNFIGTGSAPLIRREALEEVGGYDPGLRAAGAEGCEDWKMQLLLAERCDFEVVPQYLVGYRRLPTSMSANFWAMWRSRELVREEMRRRHPDLPKFLFRWLRANSARARGTQFLKQRDLAAALSYFAQAAVLDPFGTSRAMVKSGLRASGWMRTFALRGQLDGFKISHGPHAGATDTVLGRPFLSVDTRITNVLDVKASSAWSAARIERARRIQRPNPPRESLRKTAWSAAGNRPDLDCTSKSASSES